MTVIRLFSSLTIAIATAVAFLPPIVIADSIQISGRYPHLAMFNDSRECGLGAAVVWQDRLWVITYSPHFPAGNSGDKLYTIDENLNMTVFPGSVGGTPANRMIHPESNQLFIGPYVIDAERNVRVIPMGSSPRDAEENKIYGRLTATARHIEDPANKVYHFDMEGMLYEVDVRTLEVTSLFVRAIPGWHAKGGYTGQGRLVLANNGEWMWASARPFEELFDYRIEPEHGEGICPSCRSARCGASEEFPEKVGALADWDGGENWRLIKRRQFTEVTGPGGIYGAPDETTPVWATGWDKRSLILMVMEDGKWHEFRLPKPDYSYDGHHGWHTEWPRIREVVPARDGRPPRFLMNKHGGFFDFPVGFSASNRSGLRPIGSYLKIVSDSLDWNGRIVFACNETSTFDNPLAGQAQSNLWFSEWEKLRELGRPAGWGGPWMHDDLRADVPSVPFLIAGYDRRVLHLAHETDVSVSFALEINRTGEGDWEIYQTLAVPPGGYRYHIFDDSLQGEWVRLTPDRDAVSATAYFHFGSSRGAVTDESLFASLATLDAPQYNAGIIRPRGGGLGTLHALSWTVDAGGNAVEAGHYEIDKDMVLRHQPSDTVAIEYLRDNGRIERLEFEVDEASVILTEGNRRFRLPKTDPRYDEKGPAGWPRTIREVVTERTVLHAHGTFYMLPRRNSGGARAMKPVATHDRRIHDWCSWRGMLVIAGTAADAANDDPHFVRSDDGETGLWFGDFDDLWKLGKPRGRGGPWKETAVRAGEPSDPYLMTGYEKKRVELSHDSGETVVFSLEVDVFGAVDTEETWFLYKEISIPAGETVAHDFPEGFAAHWIRLRAETDCTASAIFVYE